MPPPSIPLNPKPTCSQPGCGLQFRTIELLRKHLVNVHRLNHPEHVYNCQTEQEFISWKEQYEADNLVNFNQRRKYKDVHGIEHITLRCNRCYKYGSSSSAAVKGRKYTVSLIMNVVCTCTLIVSHKMNEIEVHLFPTHYNHDLDISHKQHLKIPKAEKEVIVKRLNDGVPRARIIQDLRKEYSKIPKKDALPRHYSSAGRVYNYERGLKPVLTDQ